MGEVSLAQPRVVNFLIRGETMIVSIQKRSASLPHKILSSFIAFTFIFSLILPPGYAQVGTGFKPVPTILNLPAPGAMVTPSAAFTPTLIKGLTIHPENPLEFDFIVEKEDNPPQGEEFNKESMKLVKYFLASLTVPEDQMWVNLSPYENDRIISGNLGATEMGKDMLAQDYILKQLTASLMYPENELGKKFWDRIYKKAYDKYGTTEIPMNTFNKVWIVPQKAVVYEHGNSAFVIKSHLKVMLEEDYEASRHNQSDAESRASREELSEARDEAPIQLKSLVPGSQTSGTRDDFNSPAVTQVIREVLIPAIEVEVNAGETFANLRQIYNSMILATWYKKKLKAGTGRDLSLLGQVYVDKGKTRGVDLKDPQVNQKIYEQYIEAFKKGVYNYIKEDYDPATKEIIPRKYFSGGAVGLKESNLTTLYRLPARQQEEIISAFRDIGNTPGARFNNLKIKLYEIAEANEISEAVMTEIVKGVENATADEAQNLFVGESSVSSPVMVDGQTPAESFKSVGFKDDLASMISGTIGLAFEVRRHFRDRRNISKDESIIQRVVFALRGNENIREIKVAGEPAARVNRGTGEYSVIIAQDYSMVERKSGFSAGTMLGVYKEAELIGSIFFLNGPITTMAVTDGKRIAHYAYDGEQFVIRSDVAIDLSAPTGKDSPSALGGVYTEWPQLFQDYYLVHGRGVPGSQEAALKTRYSGVLGEDGLVHGATGANLYEILVNNGFLTEIVSLEQAKILSLFAQGAGGSAFIMTAGGPESPRDLPGEMPAVQVYLGNKDAVGKLSAYFEARKGEYAPKELRPRFLPVFKKVEVVSPFHAVKLEDFLRLEVPDMDERPDLIGAVMAVAQAAQKVGAMYVTGSRATGQIDSGGAKQLAIDEQTDQLFMNALRPWIKEYYSEDLGHVVDFNGDGIRLRVMIDALDGSSRVRGNGGSGTIVNFRKFLPDIPLEEQTGKEIVASMIIAHGITPKLILAIEGTGVYEFILDEGTFYGARAIDLSQPKIQEKGLRIALGGERPAWPKGFSELVDQWIQQGAIPGYSGALVTDIWGAINHMLDGGHAIFSYPANKLRVKSELQAIAYLFKVAGGANLTYRHTDGKEAQGLTDLLDVALTPEPDPAKQQKAPSAFGDAQTIQGMRSTLAGSSPVGDIYTLWEELNKTGAKDNDTRVVKFVNYLRSILDDPHTRVRMAEGLTSGQRDRLKAVNNFLLARDIEQRYLTFSTNLNFVYYWYQFVPLEEGNKIKYIDERTEYDLWNRTSHRYNVLGIPKIFLDSDPQDLGNTIEAWLVDSHKDRKSEIYKSWAAEDIINAIEGKPLASSPVAVEDTIFRTRRSGVLMHITSLPSKYGNGDLGPQAYQFVDFLAETGQTIWQHLPIGPTNPGDNSPYNSPSPNAGNKLFISPELLFQDRLLDQEDLDSAPEFPEGRTSDQQARAYKDKILGKAFQYFREKPEWRDEFDAFVRDNAYWLEEYALMETLKKGKGGQPWFRWEEGDHKFHKEGGLREFISRHQDAINQVRFEQFIFNKQWHALKAYANAKGIKLFGDMPIYVPRESEAVWANPHLFKLDTQLEPTGVSGVPPDYFSPTGQLWNHPVYRWEAHQREGFQWWKNRLRRQLDLYDYIRVDHFRGLVQYWEVPPGAKTAMAEEGAKWQDVPTNALLDALKEEFGELPIIAEDLGEITPDVIEARDKYGLPGLRILHFAFGDKGDEWEKNPFLPHNYAVNTVAYTGTHDNNTTSGWLKEDADGLARQRLEEYLREQGHESNEGGIYWTLIEMAMDSVAAATIFPVQDVLGLGAEHRMNRPGEAEGHWRWQMTTEQFKKLADEGVKLRKLTESSGRASVSSPVSFKGISQKAGEKLFDIMPLTEEERSKIEMVTVMRGEGLVYERQAFVVLPGGRHLKVYLTPKTVRALEDAVKAGNSIENTIGEEFDRLNNETTDPEVILDEVRMAGKGSGVSSSPMAGGTFRKGGIDLNPALLDLQIKRDGNGVPLPLPMQPIENMHIEGFLPIIINVTPITNLPLLLGLADTESDAEETRPTLKAREPEEISSLTVPLSI